ncbi:TRAP transporter large permease [Salinibacterium sp. SYSU T00001]|uniref:TRAP transporter large permease n=1 Tax=Homoserinimonas sedimenticola TaxID=2986805 RepID=UPI0022354D2F|nr:TRAP transporter large permease [Salinibacterium sedimenticola]MCW4385484.1 TRAP transporter large permease [Salinibacterium sedimenticola]
MTIALIAIAILVLLFLRVPVAFAILGPCAVYFMAEGYSPGLALKTVFDAVNSFPLLAVPLFIFVGVVANKLGIADRLFEFCLAALSRVRGNLAYVNVATSVGFSWMSGSALADAAGLGKVQVPAMVRAGYPFRFAAGLTGSSALISPVMPPSIPAVIFAAVATVSTGALFAASVIPAVLMALGLVVYIAIWVRKQPQLASEPFSAARLGRATLRVLGPLGAPIIILGGIIGGVFTPTEAAGIAGLYMIVIGLFMRSVTFKLLWDAAKETVFLCAGIMIIIGAAGMLGQVLARERVAIAVADWMTGLTDNPVVFLLLLNVILIVLGMIVEATAVILVTVPVLLPVALSFGIDPIHFGVVMILNLMIGLLTPPVGGVLYVLSSVTGRPVDEIFRGILPFLVPMVAVLLILTFFPDVSLFLPRLLGF